MAAAERTGETPATWSPAVANAPGRAWAPSLSEAVVSGPGGPSGPSGPSGLSGPSSTVPAEPESPFVPRHRRIVSAAGLQDAPEAAAPTYAARRTVAHVPRHAAVVSPAHPVIDADPARVVTHDFGHRRRAGARHTSVTVDGTRLTIVVGKAYPSRHVFDLSTARCTMVGEPGTRRWRLLFERRSLAPYALDAEIVADPAGLVRALAALCPTLRPSLDLSAGADARADRPRGRRRPPESPASRRR